MGPRVVSSQAGRSAPIRLLSCHAGDDLRIKAGCVSHLRHRVANGRLNVYNENHCADLTCLANAMMLLSVSVMLAVVCVPLDLGREYLPRWKLYRPCSQH